ncbi:MAG: hypothetical protein AB7P40_00390 [Chloroflexota bacterium]
MTGLTQQPEDRDTEELFYQHPVRAVPLGPPSDAQLELIRAHVVDPAILDEREPFVWQAVGSNDREDAYSTRMHRSTLENFATDATAGVAFMNSHRTGGFIGSAELPLGRTFEGRVVGASSSGPLRVEVTSYTLRGLNLNGLSTDAFIEGMRSGIARDVSVGFYGGEYRCSICDRDMLRDWECRHWPGREYPKLDSKGNDTGEKVRAVAWIHNARLAELSVVYDGATPGCMVSKAKRMAVAGELKPSELEFLEARYRIALPRSARSFPAADIQPPGEGARMDLTAEQIAAIRLMLTEAGAPADAAIPDTVRALVDEVRTLRALPAEIERLTPFEAECTRLRPLADEGRQYRADEVKRALAEGARAYGQDFAEETYRGLLEAAPLETVQRMAADWKSVGDKTFPGGRVTQSESEPVEITGRRRRVPAAARG